MEVVDQLRIQDTFVPTAGQTMVGIVRKYGTPLYLAHVKLSTIILNKVDSVSVSDWNKANTFPMVCGMLNKPVDGEVRLAASTLILFWIAGHALEKLKSDDTIYDAEKWAGVPENEMLSKYFDEDEINNIQVYLNHFSFNHTIISILPYLTELFETGDELLIESGIGRKSKKKSGIYYTPIDVVRFMTERSYLKYLERKKEKNVKWLDPAAGTGVFLIQALNILSEKGHRKSLSEKLQLSKSCIYGMDISVIALQTTAILLSINILIDDNSSSSNFVFRKIAEEIGGNLKVVDSTQVSSSFHIKSIFGSNHQGYFDIIVSNPPYAKANNLQTDLFGNLSKTEAVSQNIYPHFVKLLYNLTANDFGVGSIVVPLSITTSSNPQFKKLRSYIQSTKDVETEFWNFDRTPDSLFGDDVKTRNTILFFTKRELGGRHNMKSSYLNRWNSRNRNCLFNNISITQIGSEIINGVPKIGSLIGYNLLKEIKDSNFGLLEELIIASKKNSIEEVSFFTKSTAYNWLTVQLPNEQSIGEQAGLVSWNLRNKSLGENCIYALLSCRLSFWLWRVYGDGFHLTRTFICNLPYGAKFFEEIDQDKLSLLGKKLWTASYANRVKTSNAGKSSYSYSPYSDSDTLDQIDYLVLNGLKLQKGISNYLKSYITGLICAGREKENQFLIQVKRQKLSKN